MTRSAKLAASSTAASTASAARLSHTPHGDARAPVARLRDAAATRKAILAAARRHFARSGYEGAHLKNIAAQAGVDAALINRYFGGKDGLFEAALEQAVRPSQLVKADRREFGRTAARAFATGPRAKTDAELEAFTIILHAATSPKTTPLLNQAAQAQFLGPIRDWLGGEDAPARARLLAAIFIGLIVERRMRGETLRGAERAAFESRLETFLQSIVDG